MNQWNANSWKFILPVYLTFHKIQNMHLKQPYGVSWFECNLWFSFQHIGCTTDYLELQDFILLGFTWPRWNLSSWRFCRQAWFGWPWHRWMSPCCNASLLWTDFIGRSYKRSSGTRYLFVKLGSFIYGWCFTMGMSYCQHCTCVYLNSK